MIEAENPSHSSSVNMTDHLFISAGMHYYVAGRYAVFAGLNPTAANLLHHAVEMALKGALAKKGMALKASTASTPSLAGKLVQSNSSHMPESSRRSASSPDRCT